MKEGDELSPTPTGNSYQDGFTPEEVANAQEAIGQGKANQDTPQTRAALVASVRAFINNRIAGIYGPNAPLMPEVKTAVANYVSTNFPTSGAATSPTAPDGGITDVELQRRFDALQTPGLLPSGVSIPQEYKDALGTLDKTITEARQAGLVSQNSQGKAAFIAAFTKSVYDAAPTSAIAKGDIALTASIVQDWASQLFTTDDTGLSPYNSYRDQQFPNPLVQSNPIGQFVSKMAPGLAKATTIDLPASSGRSQATIADLEKGAVRVAGAERDINAQLAAIYKHLGGITEANGYSMADVDAADAALNQVYQSSPDWLVAFDHARQADPNVSATNFLTLNGGLATILSNHLSGTDMAATVIPGDPFGTIAGVANFANQQAKKVAAQGQAKITTAAALSGLTAEQQDRLDPKTLAAAQAGDPAAVAKLQDDIRAGKVQDKAEATAKNTVDTQNSLDATLEDWKAKNPNSDFSAVDTKQIMADSGGNATVAGKNLTAATTAIVQGDKNVSDFQGAVQPLVQTKDAAGAQLTHGFASANPPSFVGRILKAGAAHDATDALELAKTHSLYQTAFQGDEGAAKSAVDRVWNDPANQVNGKPDWSKVAQGIHAATIRATGDASAAAGNASAFKTGNPAADEAARREYDQQVFGGTGRLPVGSEPRLVNTYPQPKPNPNPVRPTAVAV